MRKSLGRIRKSLSAVCTRTGIFPGACYTLANLAIGAALLGKFKSDQYFTDFRVQSL
jgi:hypothetical protein